MRLRTPPLPRQAGRLLAFGAALGLALALAGQGLLPPPAVPPAAAQVAEQAAGDWPQLQHDVKRTGQNPAALTGPFTQAWTRNLGVALAHRVQPVIADGVVVVGAVDGRVFGLNESTGAIQWQYQTGGPISYSAALDGGRAFVASQDGYLYALDLQTGALLWRAKTGRKPAGGAPLVYNGRVYVSGKDGYLRAFEIASNGGLAWAFDTALANPPTLRAAILSSPAISPAKGAVYFAAENLRAYAVNLANGTLLWSYQMYGESAYDSWPVVSETNNVVMFRTKSVYSFHASLGLDDGELFCPGDQDIACGSCANWDPGNQAYNAPAAANTVDSSDTAQWNEQHYVDGDNTIESIDEIFLKYPQRRTFYALNLDTGAHLPAPILWTGGGGRLGIPPVVNETTGNVYVLARTKYSRRDAAYFCRKWVDLVRLTFNSTQGTFHFLPCQGGVNCPDSWLLHFIGDETTVLSLAGDRLMGSGWFHTGSVSVVNGEYFAVSNWDGPYDDPEGATGSGGDSAAPASVANGRVFVKQHASGSGLITIVTAFRKQ
jgi:hypothetical protein